jgi:hypothetical protein
MIYSLKDAGERDRLKETTFIQLNYMVGLWAMSGESNILEGIDNFILRAVNN